MPGGIVCSIATCKNNSKKAKETGEGLRFFSFPKDPKIQKEWVKKCLRKEKWNCDYKRICSKHFKPDDFEDELQARLLNLIPKKLKKNAIPSLFLPMPTEIFKDAERSKRMIRKKNKLVVDNLITPVGLYEHEEAKNEKVIDIFSPNERDDIGKNEIEALEKENANLKQKIKSHDNYKKQLQQGISRLEEQLRKNRAGFEEKLKFVFRDFLTSNQVDIILKKKSKARWTQDELFRAFTLRYFSKFLHLFKIDLALSSPSIGRRRKGCKRKVGKWKA